MLKGTVRFGLHGAIGSGTGGSVAGGSYTDAGRPESRVLGFIACGAIGGLALGLALWNWREAIILILVGASALPSTLVIFCTPRRDGTQGCVDTAA